MARSKADKARSFLNLSAHQRTNAEYDHLFKFVLIGDESVGKSCLARKWVNNSFTPTYDPTIGVEFNARNFQLDGKTIKCQSWDTSGNVRYKSLINLYYRGAHCIIIAFDLTNANSFHKVQDWINNARTYSNEHENTKLLIVGTKADLVDKRVVDAQQAKAFCESQQIPYIETSALNGQNVNLVFETATKMALEKVSPAISQRPKVSTDDVRLGIINELNKYITRIESHQNKDRSRPDFTYGFWFFSQSRAINREANYYLAVQLRDKLKSSEESIEDIFSNIDEQRKEIINLHKLNNRPAFSDRGINSSELNEIIDSVKNAFGKSY